MQPEGGVVGLASHFPRGGAERRVVCARASMLREAEEAGAATERD